MDSPTFIDYSFSLIAIHAVITTTSIASLTQFYATGHRAFLHYPLMSISLGILLGAHRFLPLGHIHTPDTHYIHLFIFSFALGIKGFCYALFQSKENQRKKNTLITKKHALLVSALFIIIFLLPEHPSHLLANSLLILFIIQSIIYATNNHDENIRFILISICGLIALPLIITSIEIFSYLLNTTAPKDSSINIASCVFCLAFFTAANEITRNIYQQEKQSTLLYKEHLNKIVTEEKELSNKRLLKLIAAEKKQKQQKWLTRNSKNLSDQLSKLKSATKSLEKNKSSELILQSVDYAASILNEIEPKKEETKQKTPITSIFQRLEKTFDHYPLDVEKNITFHSCEGFINKPDVLYRILVNFIENAIKHANGKNISIQGEAINGEIVISVKDDGKGFKKEKLTQIFKPFKKLDEESPGYGIGLSSSLNLALENNMKINAHSTPNKGSTFSITQKNTHA